jgi:NADPH:quinone reductase-like Zn-dependent oxidoreductase
MRLLITKPRNSKLAKQYSIKFISQQTKTTIEKLQKIATLIDQGAIKVMVDKVFALEQAAEALDYLQNGHPKGKVVIKIK